jgi:hypothetical protein
MKSFHCLGFAAVAGAVALSTAIAQDNTRIENTVVKAGEVYQLETISPLVDQPDRVTILSFGPKSWVYVEYEQSVLKPGELLPSNRKGQMWVNFDHVIAARKITPESTPPFVGEHTKR